MAVLTLYSPPQALQHRVTGGNPQGQRRKIREETMWGRTGVGEGHTPPPGTKDRNGEEAQRETEAERHGQGKAESQKIRQQRPRSHEGPWREASDSGARREGRGPRMTWGPGPCRRPHPCRLLALAVPSCTNTGFVGQTNLGGVWAGIPFMQQLLPCGETPPI